MIKPYIHALISVVLIEILLALALIIIPGLFLGITTAKIFELIPFYSLSVAVVTIVIVVFIGLPIFELLRRLGLATNRNLMIIGFFIPVIILVFLDIFFSVSEGFSSGQSYYGTYREMIVNGARTSWGWLEFIEELVKFGIHGLAGALVFKVVWFKIAADGK